MTFRQHKGFISSLCWYPVDLGLFVSGGADGKVHSWDSSTLTPVETVQPFLTPPDEYSLGSPGIIHDLAMPSVGTCHALVAGELCVRAAMLFCFFVVPCGYSLLNTVFCSRC